MRIFGWFFIVMGLLIVLMGGLWTLQGLGIVMWPAESFMLADRQWAINGAGLLVMWLGRTLVRRGR
jgi:hypothetical protein